MMIATLLVVEDNATQQHVIRTLCNWFNYEVHIVSTAEEALDALACSTMYAAVLLDLGLPGLDGFQCARTIRQEESQGATHVPIIALTARATDEDRKKCLESGMDDYLSKPFAPEEFRRMLLRWAYRPKEPNLKLLESTAQLKPLDG